MRLSFFGIVALNVQTVGSKSIGTTMLPYLTKSFTGVLQDQAKNNQCVNPDAENVDKYEPVLKSYYIPCTRTRKKDKVTLLFQE